MTCEIQKINNPQGKGVVGVSEDLRAFSPTHVQVKSSQQWLADHFTSTLVLGAEYGFKPVIGRYYYLYFKDQEWKLSLIDPQAWATQNPGIFFAECVLNKDMSWSLMLSSDWQEHESVTSIIRELEQAFFENINDARPLVEKLPFFMQKLSYYQRLGANALARSLKRSLELKFGEQKSLCFTGASLVADLQGIKSPLLGVPNSN